MKKKIFILLAILYAIPSFPQTMEWYIKDNYVDIKYMGNNLFKVKNSQSKWGVINEYGETTVEIQYDSITPMVENRALLLDHTGQYLKGIINEKGQIIKSFHNDEILANFQYFNEGMLAYGVAAGKYYLFGYLDKNGNTRITPEYYWAAPFYNGKAVIQYTSKNYGLIDVSGGTTLNDNRRINFMSTPVDNKLLISIASKRGEKVILANLEPNGKLNELEELEGGTVVKNSSDYKSISCQNGHSYYFDNAMRLISSSTGKVYNEPLVFYDHTSSNISSFEKKREQGGWKVLRTGNTLFKSSFRNILFCGNEYAIVTSQRNMMGVLKLNIMGSVSIQNIPPKTVFYHNALVEESLAINIDALFPSSQVQIGVIGLKENDQEERFKVPVGYYGVYNQPISYFIPANSYNTEVSLPIKVNLYIDDMLYKTESRTLVGIHKNAYRISEANAPMFSDPDGSGTITFDVQSLESVPSSSAKVIIGGDFNLSKHFNGGDLIHFKIPVKVPVESVKTFSFTITIKEDDCPSYTKNIKRTIKHYDLK